MQADTKPRGKFIGIGCGSFGTTVKERRPLIKYF